jgi:vitamin B12 transporter
MNKRGSLFLPLLVFSAPAFAQDCDESCQATLEYERNQAGLGSVAEDTDEPASIADCFDYCGPLIVEGRAGRFDGAGLGKSISIAVDSSEGIEGALSTVAGLQQFRRSNSRSANPTSQGITLRGLGGNASSRALVILDGVPQMDPFGGWISWTGIDMTAVNTALISSGGGYVRHGSGAISGVIELLSAEANIGDTGPQFNFGLKGGGFATAGAEVSGLADIGGVIAQFAGETERSDGFKPILAGQRGVADGRASYLRRGASLRLLRAVTAGIELQGNVRHWDDVRNRGLAFSDNRNSGTDASVRLVGSGTIDWVLLGYFQDRNFSSQFGSVSADRSTVAPVLDQYAVPAQGWGGQAQVRFDLFTNADLRIGADWRGTSGATRENFFFTGAVPGRNRIAGGETETYGGYADFSYSPFYKFNFSLSGRLDQWRINDGFRREVNIGGSVRSDDRFSDRKGSEESARAAFDWEFFQSGTNSNAHFFGSLFTGWRLPTLNELYRPFRVGSDATAANEMLSPERVKGADLGVRWDAGNIQFSLTGFASRLDHAIANVGVSAGPGNFPGVGFVAAGGIYRQRQNLDAINSKGVELEANGWLTDNVKIAASYSLIDAKVKSGGSALALNGLRPAQVARHSANLALLFDATGQASKASEAFVGSGVELHYYGKQFEDDANRLSLGDALTVDARLRYRLADGATITASAENIFDVTVAAAVSSAGIIERASPRTIWLGVRFAVP